MMHRNHRPHRYTCGGGLTHTVNFGHTKTCHTCTTRMSHPCIYVHAKLRCGGIGGGDSGGSGVGCFPCWSSWRSWLSPCVYRACRRQWVCAGGAGLCNWETRWEAIPAAHCISSRSSSSSEPRCETGAHHSGWAGLCAVKHTPSRARGCEW
jgi:hypothetical protein